MTSLQNNNTESIYLNVQCLNNSNTSSSSILATINQQCNPIVQDLSKYDVYLQSMTLTTSDLPFFNIYNNINWIPNGAIDSMINFTNNRTNLTITIESYDPATYPFTIPAPNPLYYGINPDAGNPNNFNGVVVYLQYNSENEPQLGQGVNPETSSTPATPHTYFNVHSIAQFLSMINTAITLAFSLTAMPDAIDRPFFYFDSQSQLYGFNCDSDIIFKPDAAPPTNPWYGLLFYFNSFLQRYLDGFRWIFYKNSNITSATYDGKDYLYSAVSNSKTVTAGVYDVFAEYSTVANLVDTHSIIITCERGSLSSLRQQILPADSPNVMNLPTISALKNIDIDFSSLTLSSINNCFLQYEADMMSFPINGLTAQPLNNIQLNLYAMSVANVLRPIYIPAGGYANIKFILRKKPSS